MKNSILGNLNPSPDAARIAELEAKLATYRRKYRELETKLTERTLAAGLAGVVFVEHPERVTPARAEVRRASWVEARRV